MEPMTKARVAIVACALLALLVACGDVLAEQRKAEAERELNITQNVIEKVRRLVEESENRRAEEPLRRAVELQGRAMREYRGNSFGVTVRLTLVARDFAKRAAKLAGEASENRELVLRELDRTRDILRDARERVGEAGERGAGDLVGTALERQEQAETAFREGRFRLALRMTQMARDLGHKALETVRGEPGARPQRVGDAIEKTDEILSDISSALEGDKPPLLEEALRLQEKAAADFSAGRFGSALKFTLTARDLAQKSFVEKDGPEGIAREIETTRELMTRADRAAMESNSDQAKALVKQARSYLEKAEAHFRDADYVAARAHLKLARRTAEKAIEAAGGT
jgi:tetratricopeptide (TPR) repeat protein